MIKVSPSQPNYLTINPDGTVSADFSGIIHAQGLILQTATDQSAPESESEIQWINPLGDTVLQKYGGTSGDPVDEEYFSTEYLNVPPGQAGIMLQQIIQNGLVTGIESYADTDANYTYVQAQAQDYTATILDSNNNSSFALTGTGAAASVTQSSGVSTTSSIPTPVTSINITVKKTTANILLLMSGTCWTTEAGSELGVAWNIDSGGWNNAFPGNSGLFYFNDTGVHASFGPTAVIIPNVAQGQHTLEMGVSAWYGQITQNGNDVNTMVAIELP